MSNLLIQQKKLQNEAWRVLEELLFMEQLASFGNVQVVGSLEFGLMTWPDIDLEVIVEKMPEKRKIGELGSKLFHLPSVIRVWMMDNRKKHNPHHPTGLYLGIKQDVSGVVWKIDTWFIRPSDERTGIDAIEWVKGKLTPETREVILSIKHAIAHNPKYRKQIFSIDIYKAVLDEGVKDLEGFKEYLKKTGRKL